MTFIDILILLGVGTIIFFIVKSFFKKKSPCAGCPSARSCKGKCAHEHIGKEDKEDKN